MARPIKTGLEYFSLDCHMSDEVNLIIADYGMEGYGILVSMFQLIYGEKGYFTNWSLREQKLFARRVGLSQDIVSKIISECVEWGIFDKTMFDEYNILTSKRIQRHYSTATYKRTGTTMNVDYLLISLSDKKHVNKVKEKPIDNGVSDDGNKATTDVSDDKSTQSTVQYSTVQYLNDIVAHYELNCKTLPQPQKITDQRKKAINARIADYGFEKVIEVLDKAESSKFLTKSSDKKWLKFDWIFNPNNFVKILEGDYDNKDKSNKNIGIKIDRSKEGIVKL